MNETFLGVFIFFVFFVFCFFVFGFFGVSLEVYWVLCDVGEIEAILGGFLGANVSINGGY